MVERVAILVRAGRSPGPIATYRDEANARCGLPPRSLFGGGGLAGATTSKPRPRIAGEGTASLAGSWRATTRARTSGGQR